VRKKTKRGEKRDGVPKDNAKRNLWKEFSWPGERKERRGERQWKTPNETRNQEQKRENGQKGKRGVGGTPLRKGGKKLNKI